MGKRVKEQDSKRMTLWLRGASSEPSGFSGGGPMMNSVWLLRERARVEAKGVRCRIGENPELPGYFALYRA